MAHYQIFIPNVTGANPDLLKQVGLGDLLREDEPGPDFMHVDRGPNGASGVVATWRKGNPDIDPKLGMYPEVTWTEGIMNPFWLGVEENRPPQPADLARKNQIPGIPMTMADGFAWLLPTISKFPHNLVLQKDGEIGREIKPQFQEFYEIGTKMVAQVLQQFNALEEKFAEEFKSAVDYSIPVEIKDGTKVIAQALCINYRINLEIGSMLKMFDEPTAGMAWAHFCELFEIRQASEAQKKTLPPITIHVGLPT